MALTSKGRIASLRLAGGRSSAVVGSALTNVQVKLSTSQRSEIEFDAVDSPTHALARAKWMRGAALSFNGQRFIVTQIEKSTDGGVPKLHVTAQSRYVKALEAQTGAKNWGNKVDRRAWAKARARSVGMTFAAPASLGRGKMRRAKKKTGEEAESTWALLVKVAADRRALIFEYGSRLIIGSPSWLLSSTYTGRDWSLWYNSAKSMHAALTGSPSETWDPDQDGHYTLSVSLLSPDAHQIKPGDTLNMSGTGMLRRGKWLVTEVNLTADTYSPVTVTAIRPYRLERQAITFEATDAEKKAAAAKKKAAAAAKRKRKAAARKGSKTSSVGVSVGSALRRAAAAGNRAGGGGALAGVGSALAGSGRRAALVAWGSRYVGRSIDFDGGYGAQCVDGFKMFSSHFVGVVIRGNGKDCVNNAVASGAYTRVSAASAHAGDIISWGSSWGGGYGHIAVVVDPPRGGTVRVWNQLNGVIRFSTLSTRGVVGYARPKRWR